MMPMTKRQFLGSAGGLAATLLPFAAFERAFAQVAAVAPAELAQDEAFWESIRRQYVVTRDFIQLENGYYSLASEPVLDAYVRHVRDVNAQSSFYMRTKQVDDKLAVRRALARMLGCPAEELIVTRNTTEALDTVISGFDWKPGDEAVMAEQDYGSMLDMFKLQARRHGMANRIVSVPLQPASDDEIVALYEGAITPKTRLLMVCHMINITGQILPIGKIVAMAHRRRAATAPRRGRGARAGCRCRAARRATCAGCCRSSRSRRGRRCGNRAARTCASRRP
jgi:histidinol-phosphate/aromatic aminotransferase/cobyric acid decarboxylase-like protein